MVAMGALSNVMYSNQDVVAQNHGLAMADMVNGDFHFQ